MAPRTTPPTFSGFTAAAFDFYEGLEADNSKAYWLDHKPTFDVHVKAAMQSLLDSFPAPFQPWRVFRPNRDVRFAKDKSPYKTQHGAVCEQDGSLWYVQISAAGVMAGAGAYMLAPDQIQRLREGVADDKSGPVLEKIIRTLTKSGYQVSAGGDEPLKTTREVSTVTIREPQLLRWKGCIAAAEITDEQEITAPDLRDQILAFYKAAAPLERWLGAHVGASDSPRGFS